MWTARLRTATAAVAVSLYVLVSGPPVVIWTILSGRPRLLYATARLGVRLGFALTGITLHLAGESHLRPGPVVYAANHSSNVDSPAVFLALSRLFPHVSVLYKAELRKLPVLVWAFDVAGFVPVERANRDQSWGAIDRAAGALCDGKAFFIFPEGTRSPTGRLLPFKKGGFLMAIKAQAPVVPVVVTGGRAAMQKGSLVIRPAAVTVTFLPAIPTTGLAHEDRDQLIERVRTAMEAEMAGPGRALS